jgi:hypothetical protein
MVERGAHAVCELSDKRTNRLGSDVLLYPHDVPRMFRAIVISDCAGLTLKQDDGYNVACLQEADHTARVVGWNEAVSEVTRKVTPAAGHTSLSVARRLGSNKGVPSTNNLVALSLMCSIVPRRSCDSSCRAGSRSPSAAATAFAQSSRIRSSILRCGGDIGS